MKRYSIEEHCHHVHHYIFCRAQMLSQGKCGKEQVYMKTKRLLVMCAL